MCDRGRALMKLASLQLLLIVALATRLAAGEAGTPANLPPPIEPCFRDSELQLGLYGRSGAGDGEISARVGVSVSVFFHRYFGMNAETALIDGRFSAGQNISGSLVARYPVEFATFCFAPYTFGGLGRVAPDQRFAAHIGGGLEWRTTPNIAIDAQCRWTPAVDAAQVQLGIRLVF